MDYLNSKVIRAIRYAVTAHNGQHRKCKDGYGPPYVTHCLNVLDLAKDYVKSPQALSAAVLHDVIEDTAVTAADLEHEFGPVVTRMVLDLTLPAHIEDAPNRRELKLRHQCEAMRRTLYEAVRVIKIADKIDNVQSLIILPPAWGKKAIAAYVDSAEEVVRAALAHSDHAARYDVLRQTFVDAVREVREEYRL